MGIRESLNKYKAVTIGGATVVIVASVAFAISTIKSGATYAVDKAYYTVDDGQTWFADDISKVPPFQHDGKEAAKAYVFRAGRGEPFVAYLERFTPEGQQRMEALWQQARRAGEQTGEPPAIDAMAALGVQRTMTEVKKPGAPTWHKATEAPDDVMAIRPPDGGRLSDLVPVVP